MEQAEASGRRWWSLVRVTPDFLRDMAGDFDVVLYMNAPPDAKPGRIDRVHVKPSDEDGIILLEVYGREC